MSTELSARLFNATPALLKRVAWVAEQYPAALLDEVALKSEAAALLKSAFKVIPHRQKSYTPGSHTTFFDVYFASKYAAQMIRFLRRFSTQLQPESYDEGAVWRDIETLTSTFPEVR